MGRWSFAILGLLIFARKHEGTYLNVIFMASELQQHAWSGRFGYDQQASVFGTSGNCGDDETGFVTSIETMQRVRLSQLFSIELRMAFTVFELVFFLMFLDASFDFRVGRSCIRFLFLRVISLSSLSLLPLFFT